eukprot:6205354-Pleurochrysis_carterae.AAC.2
MGRQGCAGPWEDTDALDNWHTEHADQRDAHGCAWPAHETVRRGRAELKKADRRGVARAAPGAAARRAQLVPPDRGKDVVQLDVDGAEGQKARHEDLARPLPVPWHGRDLPRDLVGTAGRVEILAFGHVAPGDAADDCQRQRHQRPDHHDHQDRAEGKRRLPKQRGGVL